MSFPDEWNAPPAMVRDPWLPPSKPTWTLPQQAMTEDQLLGSVRDLARAGGWRMAHFRDSRREVTGGRFVGDSGAVGFPDVVLVHAASGQVLYRELKRMSGYLRPEQREWLQALVDAGEDAGVWRPCDLERIERELLAPLTRRAVTRRENHG